MTQPTDPPAQVEDRNTHESQQDSGLQPAAGIQADRDKKQQSGWLRACSEVVHAPGTRFPSRQTIGLWTLAIVMSGLAIAAISHFLAPGPVTSQLTARPAAAQPQVPPAPMATKEASAAAPEAPAGPASPVLADAEPQPQQHTPIAGDTTEHRSHSPHQALASPPSPAPALPDKTAVNWPSSQDEDQADTAPHAPPSQDQQPRGTGKRPPPAIPPGDASTTITPPPRATTIRHNPHHRHRISNRSGTGRKPPPAIRLGDASTTTTPPPLASNCQMYARATTHKQQEYGGGSHGETDRAFTRSTSARWRG
jgi:hypothetical protein